MILANTRFICEATDHIGFKSYLSMIEDIDENGNVELLVQPTYNKNEAYKFSSKETAEQATKDWLLPNLNWSILEVE